MNKIISFFGADYSVGTTMTAQSTAEILAENRKKVLLILASSNPLMDYFKTGDIINRYRPPTASHQRRAPAVWRTMSLGGPPRPRNRVP